MFKFKAMKQSPWLYKSGFIWIFVILIANGFSQVPTNLEVLKKIFLKPVATSLDSIDTSFQNIQIKKEANTDIEIWCAEVLRNFFMENQYTVYSESSKTGQWEYSIVIENAEANIYYRPIQRDLLLREKTYERQFHTLISYYIKNSDESIKQSFSKKSVFNDTLSTGQLTAVENELLPFSRGVKLKTGWKQKILEPVIVTAATIVAVYLFFSLRSG